MLLTSSVRKAVMEPNSSSQTANSFIKAVVNEEPNTYYFVPRSLPVALFLWASEARGIRRQSIRYWEQFRFN